MNLLMRMRRWQHSGVVCLTRWINLQPTSVRNIDMTNAFCRWNNAESQLTKYLVNVKPPRCEAASELQLNSVHAGCIGSTDHDQILVDQLTVCPAHRYLFSVHQNASIQCTNGSKNISIALDMQMSLEVYKIWNDIVSIVSGMWLIHNFHDLSWH